LKGPVAGAEVAIEQFRDFFGRARLLDLVQRSKDVLVQAALWICYVTHLLPSGVNMDLLRDAHLWLLFDFEISKSRRTGGHELENQSADCLRLVFSAGSGESIRSLEGIWSQDFHLPSLARARTGNRHPPLSSLVRERVLDIGDNLPCKLRIAEIPQFDCDSHRTAILSLVASASLLLCRMLVRFFPSHYGGLGPLLSVNIPLNGGLLLLSFGLTILAAGELRFGG